MINHLKMRDRRGSTGGFTLIELLVVITILGILSAVVVFAVRGSGDKGEKAALDTDERIIRTALEVYCAQNGKYPEAVGTKDAMDALVPKYLSSRSVKNLLFTANTFPNGLREGSCPGTGPQYYQIIPTQQQQDTDPGGAVAGYDSSWTTDKTIAGAFLDAVSCTDSPGLTTTCVIGGQSANQDQAVLLRGNTVAGSESINNWRPENVDGIVRLTSVDCVDANTCYAVGYFYDQNSEYIGVISRRSLDLNGNGVWTKKFTGPPAGNSGPPLTGISCASLDVCVAVGPNLILRTVDAGANWSSPTVTGLYLQPPRIKQLSSIDCPSTSVCLAAGNGNHLFRSVDGGANWAEQENTDAELLDKNGNFIQDVSCAGDDDCFFAGAYDIYNYARGRWTTAFKDVGLTVNGISCSGPVCFAVGFSGDNMTNKTGTWERLPRIADNPDLNRISCTPTSCRAVGTRSYTDADGAYHTDGVILRI